MTENYPTDWQGYTVYRSDDVLLVKYNDRLPLVPASWQCCWCRIHGGTLRLVDIDRAIEHMRLHERLGHEAGKAIAKLEAEKASSI